jgi:hypothetical protein
MHWLVIVAFMPISLLRRLMPPMMVILLIEVRTVLCFIEGSSISQ